jgi:nucleoside-diphosphate-sugar epimerase
MSWTIVGCGYVGERLARRLRDGGETVVATTRRPDRAAELGRAGIAAEVVDPYRVDELGRVIAAGAVVVDSVPTDEARGPHLPAVVRGAHAAGARRIVYLSATSVYGRAAEGAWVNEDTPVRESPRLAEERALAAAPAPLEGVALRIAAIYGPGRGVHERLRAGSYRIVGAGDGFVSRIHVDDLVSAIVAAGTVAPLLRPAYTVADDEPTTSRAHADGAAALLGLPPPPSVPLDSVPAHVAEMHLGNRRVSNARMKAELGVELRYPSWREGLRAVLGGERS